MLKTIKKQRGQEVWTNSQKQKIKQGAVSRRNGKPSRVLAQLSQMVGV
jgi:hypothetical protein